MTGKIRIKRRTAILILLTTCTALSFLLGFTARADTGEEGVMAGDSITIETGLSDVFATMDFTCLDSNYMGGYLFVADEVIPYPLCVRYAVSSNDYGTSDVRTWLNQYFADTLSVADEILPVKLKESGDSISDRVFCLSVDEVKNTSYKKITRKAWEPQRGMRYYWTRSKRENTTNQAYMMQYNGQVASSRVSLSEAGIRPAFVLGEAQKDVSQGRIWYEGDTQERELYGETYVFRCIDPNYCDAGMKRAGALFLCDTILGGNLSLFDERQNDWEVSDLRAWLNGGVDDTDGITEVVTTVGFTYAGKSSNYQLSERNFTKRKNPGIKLTDQIFCLSLEEALRYSNRLWKLEGSETDNYTQAGTHSMGYWLRTPAAKDETYSYAVTYDGRIMPEEVKNNRIGIRPAFVAEQK